MAITVLQSGSKKLRAIQITRPCLGPGGAVLTKGMQIRVPEGDAFTLVNGEQARFITDSDAAKPAAK